MDLMQETPSNSVLAALAAALRAGKSKLNDWSAIPGLLAEKGSMIHGKLGDVAIGEAPGEVQNWAEGNLPMELQPGTYIPRFKSDAQGSRGAAALEAAGFLPIGTAMKAAPLAAKGAMMIPIMHGAEANASRATSLARKAKSAAADIAKGATESDVWHDYGVSEIPRGHKATLPAEHGRFMYEIPDKPAKFSPYALGTENDKIDLLTKISPDLLTSPNPNDIKAVKNFLKADLPLSMPDNTLGDVLDHPELFESQPWLKTRQFKSGAHDPNLFGSFLAGGKGGGTIELSTLTGFEDPSSLSTPLGTTLHETQHAIQQQFGMPRGGSPSRMLPVSDFHTQGFLNDTIDALRKRGTVADAKLIEQLHIINNSGSSYGAYRNLLGEQQARAVQARAGRSPEFLAQVPPVQSYDEPSMGIDPDVMARLYAMKGSAKTPPLPPDARAALLVQFLKNYGAP